MYFKQSRNAFIRQYGPYTYIVNQVSKVDQVFTDAETFTRQIAREPRTVAKAVEALVQAFPGVARETLETDFTAFLRSLAEAGHVVLAGGTPPCTKINCGTGEAGSHRSHRDRCNRWRKRWKLCRHLPRPEG